MLDTKLKNNDKKLIATLGILIISLLFSIVMIKSYPIIYEKSKEYDYNPFESRELIDDINSTNYVLYQRLIEKKTNTVKNASDIFINNESIKSVTEDIKLEGNYSSYKEEDIKLDLKRNFEDRFNGWERTLNYDLDNLEYYALDKDSKKAVYSKSNEIDVLENSDGKSKERIDTLKEKYQFYTIIDFDEDGSISVRESYGANSKSIERTLRDINRTNVDYKIEPIKNATFIYAVPHKLYYYDNISRYISIEERAGDFVASSFVVNLSMMVAIISLLIPYRLSSQVLGFNKLCKIPLEFVIGLILFIIIFFNIYPAGIVQTSVNSDTLNYLISVNINKNMAHVLINLMNLIIWSIHFTIVFLMTTLVKYIFKIGFSNYIKNHTYTGRLLNKLVNKLRSIKNRVSAIDLKKKPNKFIFTALSINLIILVIMCIVWIFGIVLAIIYTLVMFIILKKYSKDVIKKYDKLLEATHEISHGNLDIEIDENLGVFEPIKNELQSIQKGFKMAVEKEVVSQKMKTELISNVSHDLKTPLTSIITYIDLLKNENISEENRQSYIDTIDKKSQRLENLIEDLFEMSKVNSGNIHLNKMDVDIVSLMKQTLLELSDQIEESGLIFKNNFPNEKVILNLDSQRTFRVFENLVLNITKYSMKNSRVYIDILEHEDKVDIILKNMSAVEIDFDVNNIVERFVRGDKSRNTEGSGLGLAIAKSFVELQDGRLEISVDGDLFKAKISFKKKK